ncbi:MAG: endonuclease/exonuclease/phosphatase family protein [Candidatus Marinimicrobia bacterium]|nr:endonuclease/exonuclease/phosphatase family protein [Candidatus Neomarinimicrobiota bacterium]MCF7829067.1 endonuclease/exonuclease/phosphatase family protein [Candidatus Neomarinimicrobiota bacterium]MCF7881796.1 endonuclease/exonuclease/phosphatase family protein [Candidatus Neomarinimicrobiota bacterium]
MKNLLRSKTSIRAIFLALTLFLPLSCGQITEVEDNPNDVPDLNGIAQVEIVTWNLEQFPLEGSATEDSVIKLMRGLNADIFCLQEIQNPAVLERVVSNLDNYAVYSSEFTDYMRLAVVYRVSDFDVWDVSELFVDDDYPFAGRPPLRVDFTFRGANEFPFTVINLHMKAFGDPESIERRREAAGILHTYLDSVRAAGVDTNLVVVGDWNNDLTNMSNANPYYIFWEDAEAYRFLTYDLATDASDFYDSYPGWPSFLDHILVSKALFDEAENNDVETLRLDDYMDRYLSVVSDHRPVSWQFIPNY